ncbi:CCA tRNA nucleotidyltransferase [Marinimicrococcus flavescens]|uniref:CCA tRNA nucleotidyltransferase n=1 Tax=Marinimicrococcus flavescens TaxID=3031815 RepID=A0AAP3XS85_9PROT|nr:CCA tRNA nucleotidyltransferase [Marinimicrococcus flavescens]
MSASDARPLAHAKWLRAPESHAVLRALSADGGEARFVGGCVRDALLDPDKDAADLDIATQERPERVTALLEAVGMHVVPTGLKHGTVTAHVGKHSYEITTLRRDVDCDGRHALIEYSSDFVEDAARRDFTINAMSCDADGRLFDPFGGADDLRGGRVRFVGEPRRRIREDWLRILRFFRFLARFGGEEVDAAALAACEAEREGIDRLSGERVREELLKLLVAPKAARSLRLMVETRVMRHVLPAEPAIGRFEALVDRAHGSDALLRLASLLRGSADGAQGEAVASALRLSRKDGLRLQALLALPLPGLDTTGREHRRLVWRHGLALWRDLVRLAWAEAGGDPEALAALLERLGHWKVPVFPLRGADVVALGVAPGPQVRRVLERVQARWEAADFPGEEALCRRWLEDELNPRSKG